MLLLASSVCGLFKWRQFEPEMILVAVGWYLRFSLSYRDIEELLNERGLRADHVTVWRWVQRYAPEIQRRATTQSSRRIEMNRSAMRRKYEIRLLNFSTQPPAQPIQALSPRRLRLSQPRSVPVLRV
jgi:hypothetical protein